MKTLIGVYGASGFGREVMPLAEATAGPEAELVFIDDGAAGTMVNGFACHSFEDFRQLDADRKEAAIAIADAAVRERLFHQCLDAGIGMYNVVAPTAVAGHDCTVGEGSILCSFVCLTSNLQIGKAFHANLYSYVAHECVIGDFVTFAPGVKCNGNVVVEDHAYVGTGAILKQGRPGKPTIIGKGATVGMGAVVTKDVAPGTTVVGNPARPM